VFGKKGGHLLGMLPSLPPWPNYLESVVGHGGGGRAGELKSYLITASIDAALHCQVLFFEFMMIEEGEP